MSRAPFVQAALRLLFVLALGGVALSARADEAAAAPEQVIKKFYAWYVGELVGDRDPFTDGRAEMQRYVTPRLLKEIEGKLSEEGGLDADYFLNAQDFDKEWAENVTVSTPTTKGRTRHCCRGIKKPGHGHAEAAGHPRAGGGRLEN